MKDDKVEQASEPTPNAERKPPEFHVRDLMGGGHETTIIHAGERYRLRITANNKLILTK